MEYLKEVKAKIFKSMDVAVNYEEVMNNFMGRRQSHLFQIQFSMMLNHNSWAYLITHNIISTLSLMENKAKLWNKYINESERKINKIDIHILMWNTSMSSLRWL